MLRLPFAIAKTDVQTDGQKSSSLQLKLNQVEYSEDMNRRQRSYSKT
jgi:hypothetical protein